MKKALEWFELASELDGEHNPSLYQIGLMHMKLQNLKKALAAFNRVSYNFLCSIVCLPLIHYLYLTNDGMKLLKSTDGNGHIYESRGLVNQVGSAG